MTDEMGRRVVRLARVALPVAALALLSTLFVFARTVDPTDAMPFADTDVVARAGDRQITAPHVNGRAEGGTVFEVVASRAIPDAEEPRRLAMDDPDVILTGNGPRATIRSTAGVVDSMARTLVLDGSVRLDDARGYAVRSERLEGALGTLRLVSPGPVTAAAPFGDLSAGAFAMTDEAGTRRLAFTNGVELVYQPPKK